MKINMELINMMKQKSIDFAKRECSHNNYNDLCRKKYLELSKIEGKNTYNLIMQNIDKYIEDYEEEFNDFVAHNKEIWGRGFNLLKLYYYFCSNICVQIDEAFLADIDKNLRFLVYKYVNGIAIKTFSAILCLMQNGYPDEAYALYRKLYEIHISAIFLSKSNDKVVEQFYEHSVIRDNKKDNYSWASGSELLKNKKMEHISFNTIKKSIGYITKDNDLYNDLSNIIHASTKNILNRFSFCKSDTIPLGQYDYGFCHIAINSIRSLSYVNFLYYSSFPVSATNYVLQILDLMVESSENTFKDIDNELRSKK